MAAPTDGTIRLPDDSSNSGKYLVTYAKSSGTLHRQIIVPSISHSVTGKYYFSSTQQSVSATAQNGTSTGFLWLENPSGLAAVIRGIQVDANTSSVVVAPTAPVISFTKFTYTGTASGTEVTPVEASGGVANSIVMHTAVTGMTVALVGDIGCFSIPSVLTGVGAVHAHKEVLPANPFGWSNADDTSIVLNQGEGLVVYQSVAGTTADPRRFSVQMQWLEFEV